MLPEIADARMKTHERWMREALRAARDAQARDEVPIGACVVIDEELIAVAGNRTRTDCDPTAHAEIVALRDAARKIGTIVCLRLLFTRRSSHVRCAPAL